MGLKDYTYCIFCEKTPQLFVGKYFKHSLQALNCAFYYMAEYTTEYTQTEMDNCISKMMKNGKGKMQASQMCKLSLSNRKKPVKKEKPYKVINSSDQEDRYLFSSNTKIDTTDKGTLIKNIEIFKAGTFKGIEFQQSALDKMVANFHFLKDHGTFPNVPVRADHAGWLGEVGVIDRVGGYVSDLRVVGSKLVADIRVTSDAMLSKIMEGSYINRSSEIGSYEDNKGNIYSPTLYGFAFVDIPAVEGLSPKFSFSKDKNIKLINLNIMGEEIVEEVVETPVVETPLETPTEEVVETPVETPVVETSTEVVEEVIENAAIVTSIEFSKAFPVEAAELEEFRKEKFNAFIDSLIAAGKMLPANKDAELAFAKSLSSDQFASYKTVKESTPKIVEFNAEPKEEELPAPATTVEEETPETKADAFLEKTN